VNAAVLLLFACSEFALNNPPPVPPAEPPDPDPDADFGEPPDWSTCSAGWFGQYYNLPADHPDLEPDAAPVTTTDLDWWDDTHLATRRFDGSLDLGANWWPVDEGIEGDPDYFAARWTAWLRVTTAGAMPVVLGAETVAWLSVNNVEVARVADDELGATSVDVQVSSGQFPIELRFGQLRAGASGLRFRIADGDDVQLCYPDFSGE
jgi:hypothetical protein